jgi:hypothetical protein
MAIKKEILDELLKDKDPKTMNDATGALPCRTDALSTMVDKNSKPVACSTRLPVHEGRYG